jgi:hypothetical protein
MDAAATALAQFTQDCAQQALQALEDLLLEFGHDPTTSGDRRWAPDRLPRA